MNTPLYRFIIKTVDLFLWRGTLLGEENLPEKGPAVIIANHLDFVGPIGLASALPLYLHGWVVADMMDERIAPHWLQWDFVERQLHLKPPLSRWFSHFLCSLAVPMFHSLGCIPVYRGDYEGMNKTFQKSMEVIRKDGFLLIFPEDNRLTPDPVTGMQPFQHTFSRLGELYFSETGKSLAFYPAAVHPKKVIQVGQPVMYEPNNPPGTERSRLRDVLEAAVQQLYMQLDSKYGEPGDIASQRK